MYFENESGKQVSISIKNPKPDLTKTDVMEAMESIIAQNAIFTTDMADLKTAKSARIVTRYVEELDD